MFKLVRKTLHRVWNPNSGGPAIGDRPRMPKDTLSPQEFFTSVYRDNCWKGQASRSGPGSEGDFAIQKLKLLREVFSSLSITSVLDLGCGDFHWMKELARSVPRYHGVDVVESMIQKNQEQFGNAQITFQCLDVTDPTQQRQLLVKEVDLVICLDVFGHLLTREVDSLVSFILHGLRAKLFLVTNRREAGSTDYLRREKSRCEGIDLEQHPLFLTTRPKRLRQFPALYPQDFFDLYQLKE